MSVYIYVYEAAWQPTPVFLTKESPGTEEPGRPQSMGLQRVGHDLATKHRTAYHLRKENRSHCHWR